jgi:multiple sugar transport system substrate-binding protein
MLASLACAQGSSEHTSVSADGKTHITIWNFYAGVQAPSFKLVCDEFMRQNPDIVVESLTMGQNDIHTKISMAITGNQAPDLFVRKGLPEYASQGLLLSLDSYFAQAGISKETFQPGFWDIITWKGVPYGMPTQASVPLLYYNKNMFKEAGLDPNRPPRTWDEIFEYNRKLTKYDDQGNIVQAGIDFRNLWWNDFYMFHYGAKSIYDEKSHTWLKPKEAYQYLEDVQALRDEYGAEKLNKLHAEDDVWPGLFNNHKVAMALQGEWFDYRYKLNEAIDDFGAVLWPSKQSVMDKKGGPMVYMEADVAMIPVNAPHPDAAFKFLAFFCGKDGQKLMHTGAQGSGRASALKSFGEFIDKSTNPFINAHYEAMQIPLERKFQFPKSPVIEYYRTQMTALFEELFVNNGDADKLYDQYMQRVQDAEDKFWVANQ